MAIYTQIIYIWAYNNVANNSSKIKVCISKISAVSSQKFFICFQDFADVFLYVFSVRLCE